MVWHRVVHGGPDLRQPIVADDEARRDAMVLTAAQRAQLARVPARAG